MDSHGGGDFGGGDFGGHSHHDSSSFSHSHHAPADGGHHHCHHSHHHADHSHHASDASAHASDASASGALANDAPMLFMSDTHVRRRIAAGAASHDRARETRITVGLLTIFGIVAAALVVAALAAR